MQNSKGKAIEAFDRGHWSGVWLGGVWALFLIASVQNIRGVEGMIEAAKNHWIPWWIDMPILCAIGVLFLWSSVLQRRRVALDDDRASIVRWLRTALLGDVRHSEATFLADRIEHYADLGDYEKNPRIRLETRPIKFPTPKDD